MSSLLVGIDPSSKKSAIVMGCHDKIVAFEAVPKFPEVNLATDGSTRDIVLGEKLSALASATSTAILEKWLDCGEPREVVIYIEPPILGINSLSTIVQSMAYGAVVGSLWDNFGVDVYSVQNTSWKKAIVGNGRASKQEVALWLMTNRPDLFEKCKSSQDLIDAACIYLYAKEKHELGERIREGLS